MWPIASSTLYTPVKKDVIIKDETNADYKKFHLETQRFFIRKKKQGEKKYYFFKFKEG